MAFPSDLALKGLYLLADNTDWQEWVWNKKKTISHGGVDVKLAAYVPDKRSPDEWGEYDEGSVGVHSLVFEVRGPDDTRVFVRKDGSVSSYGRESWDGPLYEVRPVEKTITAYEKVSA
jgi:hypothetical protein